MQTATMAVLWAVVLSSVAAGQQPRQDPIMTALSSADPAELDAGIQMIRDQVMLDSRNAVDRMGDRWLPLLVRARRFDAVLELTMKGALALPGDTWRIEALWSQRVSALQAAGRHKEALAEAKALWHVAGIGWTTRSMDIVAYCLRSAHPEEPGIVHRFKLQVMAGAIEDPAARAAALAGLGEPILAGIAIDPKPFEEAIAAREGKREYRTRYGTANLMLLAGRTKEARELFKDIYDTHPSGEGRYAGEGLAKAIRAEAGMIGPANVWVRSVRFP